jgi:hypothetical protein
MSAHAHECADIYHDNTVIFLNLQITKTFSKKHAGKYKETVWQLF